MRNIRKNGISLILLVIILIVIMILAGAVILTLSNNNPVQNAVNAVRLNNESTVHEALSYNQIVTGNYFIKSSPFPNVISGSLKTYIESKIGRSLAPTDLFYKVETDKLNVRTNSKNEYIFCKELNTVIEVTENDMKNIEKPMAVWFWCNTSIPNEIKYVDNQSDTVAVLDKLKQIGINIIYIPIDVTNVSRYSNFIKEAYNRDMYVYALYGDPHFIFEQNYSSCINGIIDSISEYNKYASNDSKIRGIHYDVEPYANVEWVNGQSESAKNNICRTSYINFITQSQNYAKSMGLLAGYDIPVWLDRYTVIHNGVEKNMAEEVIKLVDDITFMDYATNANNIFLSLDNRGTYTFEDGTTVTVTKSVLQHIDTYKKNYIIGVDLNTFKQEAQAKIDRPELVPTYISADYEYTYPYVTKMLNDVENKVNTFQRDNNINSQFGFSYHHIYPLLELTNY
ncbi:MAG: hypothetical protein K0R72_1096 [Clostridia bacterium]|nr:hypothetical protein [Clostridia bacterium]